MIMMRKIPVGEAMMLVCEKRWGGGETKQEKRFFSATSLNFFAGQLPPSRRRVEAVRGGGVNIKTQEDEIVLWE